MKKLIVSIASAIAAMASVAGISSLDLGRAQKCDSAVKAVALRVDSTKAAADVQVYAVRKVASYTNATEVLTSVSTNYVWTPAEVGVYSSEPFVYTNTAGNVWRNSRGSDTLSYSLVTNDLYRFTYVDGVSTNTRTVHGTNTVFVGGRSFDWTVIPQTPSLTTNIVTTAVTNVIPLLKSSVTITNAIADVTCSGGTVTTNMADGVYILGGDIIAVEGLEVSGEAVKATLIIEK